jgi:hypothetical protein
MSSYSEEETRSKAFWGPRDVDADLQILDLRNCFLQLTQGQRDQNPESFGPMASSVNGALGVKCTNPERVVVRADQAAIPSKNILSNLHETVG